jgi:HEAT repeat protein
MDVAELINALNSDQAQVRSNAAEQLSRHPDAAAAAVSLVRAAGDSDESVREWAIAALENELVPSPADLDALVELLGDRKDAVAYWAATLIGRLGADASVAVPPLRQALDPSRSSAVRERAVWALGRLGPAAKDATSELEALAAGDQPRLARLSKSALQQIAAV